MIKYYSVPILYRKIKKKPIMASRAILRFRVRINRNLRLHKSKIFRRFKRFSLIKKKFFKRYLGNSRRRSDLMFLYRKSRLATRWVPERHFSKRIKKIRKINFFIKRIREKYIKFNNFKNRVRFNYFRQTPKIYSTSPFRYQLMNDNYNRKNFRIWINKRFFGKKKRFVFRIFFFFRKLEKARFNFKTRSLPASKLKFDSRLFFEKYRKFSLWALRFSWHKFYPRIAYRLKKRERYLRKKKKILREKRRKLKYLYRRNKKLFYSKIKLLKKKKLKIKTSKKKSKKKVKVKIKKKSKKIKKFKRKSFKKKKKYRLRPVFRRSRRYKRFRILRRRYVHRSKKYFFRRNQTFRFLQTTRLSYKFPHSPRYFRTQSSRRIKKKIKSLRFNERQFKVLSRLSSLKLGFAKSGKVFFKRPFNFYKINKKQLFYTKKRLPKIYFKNFFFKKNLPLAYYFTRKSKKLGVFFKTFRKKRRKSRYIRYKHRSRLPGRFKRLFNKFRFYFSQLQGDRLSRKLNNKIFFVRRKYSKFIPYLGYFKKFGRKKFVYKRRRKKFFRFFKKFFSKFHAVSAIPTSRYNFFKRKAVKVRYFVHIFRSVNNMFVNVSAPRGRTLYSYSAGRTNFRGSKRLSPVAIETIGKAISLLLKNSKISQVGVVFHSPINYLTRALIRGFKSNLKFVYFRYYMNKPHNGLRLRASRRI
jgi:ribosomal protein S11